MKHYFDLEDVRLLPKECVVESRDECNTKVRFGDYIFNMPVVPSNMLCAISEDLAIKLAKTGNFYIMHRFNHDNVSFVRTMNNLDLITSISVGINSESYEQLKDIKNERLNLDYVCIDVAHGHSRRVIEIAKTIRELFPKAFIISGNVCTAEGVKYLEPYCDALKVGIGQGSACTTYNATSFGNRDWTGRMLFDCASVAEKPLILDGGLKTIGNIVAAYALGASMIMVGGMFSGFTDSPGDTVISDGKTYKEFFGSASEFTKGHKKYVEGKKYLIPIKQQTLLEYYSEVEYGLKSAISYAGGKDIDSLVGCDYIVLD